MWEERAHRVRREIAALAGAGLGVQDLHAEAIRLVGATVGAELACWAVIDPESLVISTMVSGDARIPPEYEPKLAEAEYSPAEPHRFAALAVRGEPVAKLSDLPAAERGRSTRLRDVWRPLGLDRELRVLFRADGACWGAAGMVRAGPDFTDRETAFLATIAPAVGAATRLAVRAEASGWPGDGRPAVVVLGPGGELRAITPSARSWQERFDEISPGRFGVIMRVMAAGARSAASGEFRARLRDGRGRWAVLRAGPLIGMDEDQVAVAIEPATGEQMVGLLLVAYGLSPRERDVCREVMAGYSTSEIGGHLFISANTVQDHLKSIFAKVGVRSRGELVARLRPDPPAR
ncbi:MAG TPA: helix-turn-helix transcriptional regulator [Actinoplanes sp.]|nr:helix-turn-helix transcriptional regulator [Actinoplanes sp.]